MADEKDKELGEGQKKVEVEASATVSDSEGPTHDVDVKGEATVTDLREKQEEKEEEKLGVNCTFCGRADAHWHADCPVAQSEASKGASDKTEKVAVAATSQRASFGASGRPD